MKYKFTTTLDRELVDRLKAQAIREHRSAAEIIEKLIRQYLDKQEQNSEDAIVEKLVRQYLREHKQNRKE